MPQSDVWYFAYGSNLSPQRMLQRIGTIPLARVGILNGYELAFRRFTGGNETYATIIPQPDAVVHGVAYLCEHQAIRQLDRFEGVAEGCYRREYVDILTNTGELLRCLVYVGEATIEGDSRPADGYLRWILTGAEEHGLPSEIIQGIKNTALQGLLGES